MLCNGFMLTVVRVFAAFQYPPLIKFEDSKKLANHQNPALSVEHVLQIVRLDLPCFLVNKLSMKCQNIFFEDGNTYCTKVQNWVGLQTFW